MKGNILFSAGMLVVLFFGVMVTGNAQVSIDQRLLIAKDDSAVGGQYSVAVQVKGTAMTAANTLGSATIDVQFDTTKLTYVDASGWAFGSADGYNRSANDNGSFIRIAITGGGVNENLNGTPNGFDLGATYATWVRINFTIDVAGPRELVIDPGSNAVSLYENHGNNPNTGVINSQTLSPPINISNTTVSVAERRGIPAQFAMDQNYPNPFNPSTSIDFALPRQEHVTLDVFNVLGQKVATLVNETRPAGYYTERFEGARLASGIYFYRMTAGRLTFLKKMLMIK